jgi:hypothetical protein
MATLLWMTVVADAAAVKQMHGAGRTTAFAEPHLVGRVVTRNASSHQHEQSFSGAGQGCAQAEKYIPRKDDDGV